MTAAHPESLVIESCTALTDPEPIEDAVVVLEDGLIAAVGPRTTTAVALDHARFDARGMVCAPGFIDLQINGGFGFDLSSDPSTVWRLAARLPSMGVTAFLHTIISGPDQRIAEGLRVFGAGPPAPADPAAAVLGLHLEGPFLAMGARGAHEARWIRPPDPAAVDDWSAATGVRFVTLAPEVPGALDLVRLLSSRGVVVSAGHSEATLEGGRAGIAAGVRYATHTFNAMPALHHQEPGLVAALIDDGRVALGFIADGVHVDPLVMRFVHELVGPDRFSVVSDAVAVLGLGPGENVLGEAPVYSDGTTVRRSDGMLAGSAAGLDTALRVLVQHAEIPPSTAVRAMTTVPARLLGDASRGTIGPGRRADLVLLDQDLAVRATFVGGRLAYQGS